MMEELEKQLGKEGEEGGKEMEEMQVIFLGRWKKLEEELVQ